MPHTAHNKLTGKALGTYLDSKELRRRGWGSFFLMVIAVFAIIYLLALVSAPVDRTTGFKCLVGFGVLMVSAAGGTSLALEFLYGNDEIEDVISELPWEEQPHIW